MGEGLGTIAGISRSVQEVDVNQLTRDVNRLLWLGPDVLVSLWVVMVMRRIECFLRENERRQALFPMVAGKMGRRRLSQQGIEGFTVAGCS